MGFVTNKWQPVSSPGPTPVPTWTLLKDGVKATTAFNYSSYDYTEYLILLYTSTTYFEFFYIPEFGTTQATSGSSSLSVYCSPQTGSKIQFIVRNSNNTAITSNYKYKIYGRNKAAWSLVSDNSSLPNYTELATANSYYTPFNYQVTEFRTAGGTQYISSSVIAYIGRGDRVYNNAYTQYSGNNNVYIRLSSNEATWNNIHSTSSTVSIADISYSEMFIVGRRMGINLSGSGVETCIQTLYVIPEMLSSTGSAYNFPSGGYNKYQNGRYTGSYGSFNVSATQISASYTYLWEGTSTNYFQSLDIYYR